MVRDIIMHHKRVKEMNKENIKDFIMEGQKFVWPAIEGVIIVIFGLYLTRSNVGAGRFETNMMFGTLSYFFLALSGQFISRSLHLSDKKESKYALIISTILYSVGFILTLIMMAVFNLDIFILIILISIGLLWVVLWLYASSKDKEELIIKILACLVFTIGIIYGASLNQVVFPIQVLTFFSIFFFLQLSREYIKEFREVEGIKKVKKHRVKNFRKKVRSKTARTPSKENIKENLKRKSVKTRIDNTQSKEILKKSLLSQILAIVLTVATLLILFLTTQIGGTTSPTMFLWFTIIFLVFMSLAAFFTQICISKSKISKKNGLLISFSMLVMLLAILLST